MRYHEVHPTLRQALGCFEGFRRLGFEADDIFFIYASRQLELFCVLKTQDKEFSINCGPLRMTQREWEATVTVATHAINTGLMPEEDLQRIWSESMVFKKSMEFLLVLKAKGIVIPVEDKLHVPTWRTGEAPDEDFSAVAPLKRPEESAIPGGPHKPKPMPKKKKRRKK